MWSGKKSKPPVVFVRDRNPAGLYEALQLAPIPTEYEAASDGPWTGNPARLWTTSVKSQTESFADADAEAGVAKGVFQLRRDVDDMDNHDFKPNSNPGWELGLFNASSDCDTIDKSFINKKEMYPLVPMAEMLSGGFVQIQEYRDRLNPEDKFDHAMNFWGPGKFVVTGEPQDRPQPTFQLRGRWNNLEYPEGLGRIHGDQLNLHWMSRLKAETNTQIMRVFHRDTEKSVNLTLYSIQLAGDDLRPASIKETGGPKKGLFRLAPVKPAYNTKFWPNERLTKLDLGSMRFFNFYTTTSFDVDRDFVARDPEPVGFKISLREMTNSKGAKVNKTEYSLCYLIKSIKYEDWNLRPVTIVDDTDGLTTPDIIKPYQTQTGKDDRILIIRRLGTSGTGSNDREMDVEVRSYRRALIEKPREPGKPHPCLTVNVIKVKGPAKFTSPISASAGWQVLVDDVRNCGRPELVFLVGREHADYNVQVFGFNDDGKLVDRNIATPPALPATLPLSSYWNVYFGGHHFAALCPSETVPWTHDILQVSRFNHYGAATWADPYLYFRTVCLVPKLPPRFQESYVIF